MIGDMHGRKFFNVPLFARHNYVGLWFLTSRSGHKHLYIVS